MTVSGAAELPRLEILADLLSPDGARRFAVAEAGGTPALFSGHHHGRLHRALSGPRCELVDAAVSIRLAEWLSPFGRGIVGSTEEALTRLSGGDSIRLNFVDRYQSVVGKICAELSVELGARIDANVYISPRNAGALALHYDVHDGLVIQVNGSKKWRVYRRLTLPTSESLPVLPFEDWRDVYKLEIESQKSIRSDLDNAAPLFEVNLLPGQALYVPRGYAHEATCEEAESTHITFALHHITVGDLFVAAMRRLAITDERFKRRFMFDNVTEAIASEAKWADLFDATLLYSTAGELQEAFSKSRTPMAPSIQHHGPLPHVRVCSGIYVAVSDHRPITKLVWGRKSMRISSEAAAQWRSLVRRRCFLVSDIPTAEKMLSSEQVASQLVEWGMLEYCRATNA